MNSNTSTAILSLKVSDVTIESIENETPTILGIPIVGYHDREITYKDLVSLSKNNTIDEDLRSHYRQVIINTKKEMKTFNCGMERFIFLQNPTTCKIRVWFD